MTLTFTKATKKAAKGRVALEGPSGSGKTYTALLLAATFGGRSGVIDTEHRSASKYADLFEFDTLPLDKYDPKLLIEALGVAAGEGIDNIIIDSLSHFWMGTDGMLEQVDRAGKRAGGHGMSGWKEMRPVERQMVEAMLAYPGHVIVTLRVKSDWVEGEGRNGRKAMVKVGTKAEQREGLEYEFDLVGALDLENELTVSKSRCPALSGAVVKKPGIEFAQTFLAWLDAGEAGPTVAELRDQALDKHATREDLLALGKTAQAAGLLAAPTVDDTGDATTLGELIVAKGRALAKASQPAAQRTGDTEQPGQPGQVSREQHRRMHALWNELGYGGDANRGQRLTITANILGVDQVESSAQLTADQADKVIAALDERRRQPAGAR